MQWMGTKKYWCSEYSRLHCTDFTVDSREKLFFICALVEMSKLLLQQFICWGWAELSVQPLSMSTHSLQHGQPMLLESHLINLVLIFFVHILLQVYLYLFLFLSLPLFLCRLPLSSSLFLFLLLQHCLPFLLKTLCTHSLPFHSAYAWLVSLQWST